MRSNSAGSAMDITEIARTAAMMRYISKVPTPIRFCHFALCNEGYSLKAFVREHYESLNSQWALKI